MKHILVVGGAGYVGGAVTDLLMTRSEYDFRVYDNLLYEDSYRKNVHFICGDVLDRDKLLPHLQWADCVIWLAAIVGDGACTLDPDLTVQINQQSVQWLAQHFNGRIIFTSTCSVYGAQSGELSETSLVNPLSLYAGTKLKSEEYLRGKNSLVFRLGTLFGVGDLFSRVRMDLVVNVMTVRAHTAGRISVFGGEQFRPVLNVKDAARAIVDAIDSPQTGVFNLLKQNIRMIDLAYQIRTHYPDIEIERTEIPFQDTRNYRVSWEKAKEVLGFIPKYPIDSGIEDLKNLMETNRVKNLADLRHSNHLFLKEVLAKKVAIVTPQP